MQSEFTFDFGQSRRNIVLIILVLLLLGHKPLLLMALLVGAYCLKSQDKAQTHSHGKDKNSPPNIKSC